MVLLSPLRRAAADDDDDDDEEEHHDADVHDDDHFWKLERLFGAPHAVAPECSIDHRTRPATSAVNGATFMSMLAASSADR